MPAKILVLSPSSQFLRLTTLLLKQEGYLVKAESHRERAVALLNATSVDILLLDLDSPDFDAYAFLRKLQEYHIKTMPVVFTKRKKSSITEQYTRYFLYSTFGLIHKPYTKDVLLQHCAQILRARTQQKRPSY